MSFHVSAKDRHIQGKPSKPKWKIALISLGVLAALAIAGYFVAKPAYVRFRLWRISQNSESAKQAFAAGRYDDARRLSLSVVRLTKKNRHEMLVVLRESMIKLDDPRAVDLARMLMVEPRHTEEDRIKGFEMTCERLPLAKVLGTWGGLENKERHDAAFVAPLVTRLIDQELYAYANQLLSQCFDIDQRPALLMQRARLLLVSGKTDAIDQAQIDISSILSGPGSESALPAFRLLSKIPWDKFHPGDFPDLDKWLDKQNDAAVSDRLTALIQHFARNPQDAAGIIDEAVKTYGEKNPGAVADWLVNLGHPERALALLPDDPESATIETFRARADALAALKQWKALAKWLANDPPANFPSLELHARRVIAAQHTGDTATRTREWEDAMRDAAAQTTRNGFLELHKWMREAGPAGFAREAMVGAVRLNRGRLPLFQQIQDLVAWLRENRRGLALLQFARVMTDLEPGNPLPASISLDLGCTSGSINPDVAAERLRKIMEKHPGIQGLNEALATALLLDNQPDEALAQLPADTAKRPDASPYALAITGVALAMKGENEKARKILDRVPWDKMLTEECDAFSRALSSTRLGKSEEQEKIRKVAEAAPPPPNEKIFRELLKKEEERKKLLKEFQEKQQ